LPPPVPVLLAPSTPVRRVLPLRRAALSRRRVTSIPTVAPVPDSGNLLGSTWVAYRNPKIPHVVEVRRSRRTAGLSPVNYRV
jgi:hypothetical protein